MTRSSRAHREDATVCVDSGQKEWEAWSRISHNSRSGTPSIRKSQPLSQRTRAGCLLIRVPCSRHLVSMQASGPVVPCTVISNHSFLSASLPLCHSARHGEWLAECPGRPVHIVGAQGASAFSTWPTCMYDATHAPRIVLRCN